MASSPARRGSRLLVEVLGGVHVGVQDANHRHCLRADTMEDDMLANRKGAQTRAQIFPGLSDERMGRKPFKSLVERSPIVVALRFAPTAPDCIGGWSGYLVGQPV